MQDDGLAGLGIKVFFLVLSRVLDHFPWALQKPRYVSTLCVSWALIALNAASSEGFRKSFVGLDLPLVCVSYMVKVFECSLAL